MNLFIYIIQYYPTSYCSENKLKPMSTILKFLGSTKMKSDGPCRALCSFCAPESRTMILYKLHWGCMKERLYLWGCRRSPRYHYTWMPFLQSHQFAGGKLFFHSLGSLSCSDTEAPMGSVLSLAHSQLGDAPEVPSSSLLLSAGSTQPVPTQSFFPGRETKADFQQTDLQTHLLIWLRSQGDPWLFVR